MSLGHGSKINDGLWRRSGSLKLAPQSGQGNDELNFEHALRKSAGTRYDYDSTFVACSLPVVIIHGLSYDLQAFWMKPMVHART